jgi:metal-responsive CopG/Arc/MetJ family transcriptional regulator
VYNVWREELEGKMVVKINVSMPEDILEKLDEAASEVNSSRSALLTRAVKLYLEEKEKEKKREIRLKAADKIIGIAEKIGPWDGTTEILKWRDRH